MGGQAGIGMPESPTTGRPACESILKERRPAAEAARPGIRGWMAARPLGPGEFGVRDWNVGRGARGHRDRVPASWTTDDAARHHEPGESDLPQAGARGGAAPRQWPRAR